MLLEMAVRVALAVVLLNMLEVVTVVQELQDKVILVLVNITCTVAVVVRELLE
jgi:hypothetical protein